LKVQKKDHPRGEQPAKEDREKSNVSKIGGDTEHPRKVAGGTKERTKKKDLNSR